MIPAAPLFPEHKGCSQRHYQHQHRHSDTGPRVPRLPVRRQRPQRALQEETAHSHTWRDYRGHRVNWRLLWAGLSKQLRGGRGREDTNRVGLTSSACHEKFGKEEI